MIPPPGDFERTQHALFISSGSSPILFVYVNDIQSSPVFTVCLAVGVVKVHPCGVRLNDRSFSVTVWRSLQ